MNKLAKVDNFFNNVDLTVDDQLYVGIDVHKRSYHVALYLNDAPALDFVMPAAKEQLSKKLKNASSAIKQVAYETGPTGYGLARHLRKNDLPVTVAATSRILRSSGDDKTDKLDSRKLAEYAAKGLLRPVSIPSLKQESDRQLYRMRHRQVRNLSRVKTQIKSFLLMHGIDEPVGLSKWSRKGVDQLRTMKLRETLRLSLDELLGDLDYYSSRVKALDKSLTEYLDKGLLARQIAILRTHPGVGVVVSCQFAVELFHFRNFSSTREVFKYLGLSPKIHQSGERSVSRPINKVSNARLRSNLVQAAWQWIRVDIEAKKTYLRLLNNCGGLKQKAIIAMARKLSGHLWTMLVNDQPYNPSK